MEADVFLRTLQKCVNEYKHLLGETSDDGDIAHYFNSSLKKFLKDNKISVNMLFAMKFNMGFSKFVETYIWKEE